MRIGFGHTKNTQWLYIFKNAILNSGHDPVLITHTNLNNKDNIISNKEVDLILMTCYGRGECVINNDHPEVSKVVNARPVNNSQHLKLRRKIYKLNQGVKIPTAYWDASVFADLLFTRSKHGVNVENDSCQAITLNMPKSKGLSYIEKYQENPERWEMFKERILALPQIENSEKNEINKVLISLHSICGYKQLQQTPLEQIRKVSEVVDKLEEWEKDIEISLHPQIIKHGIPQRICKVNEEFNEIWNKISKYFYKTRNHCISYKRLYKYDCVVGWHTNFLSNCVAIKQKAVCLDDDSFSHEIVSNNLNSIRDNEGFDKIFDETKRNKWFTKMSWCNWKEREMFDGKLIKILAEHVSSIS